MSKIRKDFEAWWDDFTYSHDEWRFADSQALRFAAYAAGRAAGMEESSAEVEALRWLDAHPESVGWAPPSVAGTKGQWMARRDGYFVLCDSLLDAIKAASGGGEGRG